MERFTTLREEEEMKFNKNVFILFFSMSIMNSFDQVTSNVDTLKQNEIIQNGLNGEAFQEKVDENSELSPLNSENEESIEKNILMCNKCQTFFYGRPNSHDCFKQSHHRQSTINSIHKCESCGNKSFSTAGVLQRHINTVHEGQKDHKCESCGKSFYLKSDLSQHKRSVHEGRRDYNCESCLKSFSKASDLKRHIYTVHEGHKDYKCKSCSQTFTRAHSLKKHIHIIHEGHKDYKCESCDKLFSQATSLRVHMKTHMENYMPDFYCVRTHVKQNSILKPYDK